MSPSEFELRGALHHGEGDDGPLDIGTVILRAEAIRRERRVRVLTVAAAAVVVLGVSTAVVITHRTPARTTTAAAANGAGSASNRVPLADQVPPDVAALPSHDASADDITATSSGLAVRPGGAAGGSSTAAATCPATAPAVTAPAAATSSQPMFSSPVVSIIACGYRASDGAQLSDAHGDRLLSSLSESDVAATVTSINAASKDAVPIPCSNPSATNGLLVLYASYASGPAKPVAASTYACDRTISNGTAERFDWTPPTGLQQFETQIDQAAAASQRITPSPIRS